jgi:2-polyprenyl-6-methoxyphenol hydroxylase-like FAD-dependent oxidoreductase
VLHNQGVRLVGEHQVDVAIVGGGIAGAALGVALARDGRNVVVLEASTQFRDRVRGECIQPWGVREAQELGVHDVLLEAGGHTMPLWRRYTEGQGEGRDIPVGFVVPGVDGCVNLGHPAACQSLLDAAVRAGAAVRRGVSDVHVSVADRPVVSWNIDGEARRVAASLVVGADGRASSVRRAAGITLREQREMGYIAGLLLDGVDVPADHDIVADTDDGLFLMFHQGSGRARAYHVVPSDRRTRYAGQLGRDRFVADAAACAVDGFEVLADAVPAGPCAAFPGTDTWTDRPYADKVVLVGDAAGHNDPTAGCGLSIALRDARMVRDVLRADGPLAPDFREYGQERNERMRRLRLIADLINTSSVEPAPNRLARRTFAAAAMADMDPRIFPLMLGMFAGPETVPAELVDDAVLDRVRAA